MNKTDVLKNKDMLLLYERIMNDVAKVVKSSLNEAFTDDLYDYDVKDEGNDHLDPAQYVIYAPNVKLEAKVKVNEFFNWWFGLKDNWDISKTPMAGNMEDFHTMYNADSILSGCETEDCEKSIYGLWCDDDGNFVEEDLLEFLAVNRDNMITIQYSRPMKNYYRYTFKLGSTLFDYYTPYSLFSEIDK